MGISKPEKHAGAPAAKPARFTDGDEWMLAEQFGDVDFFFCQLWLRSFVNRLERSCGRNYSKILAAFDGARGKHISFYYGKRDCLEMTRHLVNKITNDPGFGESINANIRKYSDELMKHAKTIPSQEKLATATNEELWSIIKTHVEKHGVLYEWGWLSNATDMFYPEYTNCLKNYLRAKATEATQPEIAEASEIKSTAGIREETSDNEEDEKQGATKMKGTPVHFTDGDEWMLAENIPDVHFFWCQIWLRTFVNRLDATAGRNNTKILAVFDGAKRNHVTFYYGKNDCISFANEIIDKIQAQPSFGEKINAEIRSRSDALVAQSRTVPSETALRNASNAELWAVLRDHSETHQRVYEWGALSNATDLYSPEFTERLKNELKQTAASNKTRITVKSEEIEQKINEWLVVLATPEAKSEEALQHEEFLELAASFYADAETRALFEKATPEEITAKLKPEHKKAFGDFAVKYAVIGALYIAEPFPLEHFANELKNEIARGDPKRALAAANEALERAKRDKHALIAELGIDEKTQRVFAVYADFMLTKFYRRYAQIRALYEMRRVFKEIARRFGITLDEARFMLTPEYEQLLVQGNFDLKQLKEREKFCVLYSEKDYDEIFLGGEARGLAAGAEEKHDATLRELKGQTASLGARPGVVRGAVKIVSTPADLPKMKQGDILVAIATNPDVVPAMKKAAAIITDQGGVTCHAAIVSRELGIPCVIGTKHATKILRDGDEVEVDAARGVVRKIS